MHLRISAPPTDPIATTASTPPTKEDLIASHKTVEEIEIDLVNSLGFLSLEGSTAQSPYREANSATPVSPGEYPIGVPESF